MTVVVAVEKGYFGPKTRSPGAHRPISMYSEEAFHGGKSRRTGRTGGRHRAGPADTQVVFVLKLMARTEEAILTISKGVKTLVIAVIASFLAISVLRLRACMVPPGPSGESAGDFVDVQSMRMMVCESMRFLVTERIVTQVVVEVSEEDFLLGSRKNLLFGTARVYFGVDLDVMTGDDVVLRDGAVVFHLPDPAVLDFAVDMDSLRYVSKRSGLIAIRESLLGVDGERELRTRFEPAAMDYMSQEGLLPTRGDILQRLDPLTELLSRHLGVRVVFQ